MSGLDDFDLMQPTSRPTFAGAHGRPHTHTYADTEQKARKWGIPRGACRGCPARLDENAARRGRVAAKAGYSAEDAIAAAYGGARRGQSNGPTDVILGERLAIQSKVGWFSERTWDELMKLPRTGGRLPTLVITDALTGRMYAVREVRDDAQLFQEIAEQGKRIEVLQAAVANVAEWIRLAGDRIPTILAPATIRAGLLGLRRR